MTTEAHKETLPHRQAVRETSTEADARVDRVGSAETVNVYIINEAHRKMRTTMGDEASSLLSLPLTHLLIQEP